VGLNAYINDTSALLHDQGFAFTSKAQLVRWINEARRQCARRTGCIQRLISGQSGFGASMQPGSIIPGGGQPGAMPGAFPNAQQNASQNSFMTITGVERYPLQGFANPYLQAQHAGCSAIMDVASITVNWGATTRPALAWMPWEDLQAYARAYSALLESYPSVWSVLNDGDNGEVWLFPVPNQPLEMEWTVYAQCSDLNSDSDYDAIPYGFSNAIKFGAASLAFFTKQMYAQAQMMEAMFADRMGTARVAADHGKVPNFYA